MKPLEKIVLGIVMSLIGALAIYDLDLYTRKEYPQINKWQKSVYSKVIDNAKRKFDLNHDGELYEKESGAFHNYIAESH